MDRTVICCVILASLTSLSCANEFESGVKAFENENYDLAVEQFSKAISASPGDPGAYFYRGLAHREKKAFAEAVSDFTHAIRFEPKPAACYYNRAIVYHAMQDFENALKDMDECVRLDPENSLVYAGRGSVLLDNQEFEKAEAGFQLAIRLDPEQAAALNNLAWLRATCPVNRFRDGEEAVVLATKACELTKENGQLVLSTLAAAYAEAGDFRKAVKWQKKAIDMGEKDKEFLIRAKRRLVLYENGEPYRLGRAGIAK
ncbi:MAG: tetratricopeptide repeat protein [Planctomycetales bacterium]|nr:tetratricopeptide repeat protein [Planctomycetales bacterium]